MKENESKNGFKEAKPWSSFFRKGRAEQWKNELSERQQSKIKENFKEQMNKFKYY